MSFAMTKGKMHSHTAPIATKSTAMTAIRPFSRRDARKVFKDCNTFSDDLLP